LQQLRIAKESITISSKRDAYKLTADKVTWFAEHIIPLINNLKEEIEKKEVTFFSESKVKIEEDKISVHTPSNEKSAKDIVEIFGELTTLLNALEAFAIYFTSGVASEELAFSSIGSAYCRCVREFLPAAVLLNDNKKNYENLLQLFIRWNSRIDKLDLLKNQKEIQKKLRKINDESITPIGIEG
jgi:hypothetical protein